jgi:hypothetical protein
MILNQETFTYRELAVIDNPPGHLPPTPPAEQVRTGDRHPTNSQESLQDTVFSADHATVYEDLFSEAVRIS